MKKREHLIMRHRALISRTSILRSALVLGAPLAILSIGSEAHAAGFATARFGGEHGHPTTDNPTAIYYNPAGIAEDSPDVKDKFWHVHIFADGNFALRFAGWSHEGSPQDQAEPAGASGANTGQADLFNFAAAPMAAATVQIENFGAGVGLFFPFGGASSWDKNEDFKDDPNFAGPYDGVQRWHAIDGIIRSMYISGAAAYDIMDRVSIGAVFNMVRSEVKTIRAREPSGTNSIDSEGRSEIDVSGWNAAFGVGITGEVAEDKVWIGFSYQSQPGLGDMVLEGTLKNNYSGSKSEEPVKLIQQLPDIYRLGVRARPVKEVEVRFFGDMTNWSMLKSQCLIPAAATECKVNADGSSNLDDPNPPLINIVRNWGPTFGIRGGGSYFMSDVVELFAGAGYDSNAVPDETLEPALTDFHKASIAGGLRFSAGETFGAALSYTHLFYVPRDVAACEVGGANTGCSQLPTLQSPSRTPDASGHYTQTVGVINANVQLNF